MSDKTKIFLDFDGTTTNSVKAYCKAYNDLYIGHKDFKYADHTKVNRWDLGDQCQLATDKVETMFAIDLFFFT